MNDIKLTDEATIDSLKEMAIKFSKDTYVNRVLVNAINLIHRLQSENKELRTESDRMVAEHLAFVELAKKANEQQKSEIAELKAQCSKSSYRDSWKNKFFKAQEEIERLTEENEYLDMVAKQALTDYQNTQVQVDELKAENTELYKEHTALIAGSILAKQNIAKDTAKEILDDLRNTFIEQSSYGCDANQHIGYYDYVVKIGLVIEQVEEYAKLKYGIEYGVEVE